LRSAASTTHVSAAREGVFRSASYLDSGITPYLGRATTLLYEHTFA